MPAVQRVGSGLTVGSVTWEERRRELADSLREDSRIRAVFATVPRHRFLPDRLWPHVVGGPLDRAADPEGWARAAYADQPVITQVNDGVPGISNKPTSSSTAPSVMAAMIRAADVSPGDRVLEIGTGTGYNAAVLCELVGTGGQVTTIEVDPDVADSALHALTATGYDPRVVVADGRAGHAPAAPFDSVVVTCGVVRLSSAWMEQTRHGGVIVVPWAPAPDLPGGMMARLVVGEDRAEGRFTGSSQFMPLREQRWAGGAPHDLEAEPEEVRSVGGDPRRMVMRDAGPQLAMTVPAIRVGMRTLKGVPEPCVWISATDCAAWARLYSDGRIEQGGPRRLGEEIIAAYDRWVGQGSPELTEYGLTVTAGGEHRVWLHDPSGPSWPQ